MLAVHVVLCQAQLVFINELHYDNAGNDSGEFVEILAPAGTDLSAYELALYNGSNGQVYQTRTLDGIVSDSGAGVGTRSFDIPGIQNGAPDGIVLYRRAEGTVLEFLSYEGSFTATGGVASGMTSTDMGVFESSSVPVGQSLQRRGSGREAGDFTWSAPANSSPGTLNAGQTISGSLDPFITVSATPTLLAENAGLDALTLSLQLLPAPDDVVNLVLTSSQPKRLPVPESVLVPSSGLLEIRLSPTDNEFVDDIQEVTITVTDPDGGRQVVSASIALLDDDRAAATFNGTLRVATYNTLNSVGAPGSAEYEAFKASIARVAPQVICFQEESAVGDFRNLRSLLSELDFLVDRQFLATAGDGFENAAPENGQFTSDQFIAIASKFPIKRTVQIGRGVAGRRELTRYPLYVEIDVPELERDPVFVGVHLKAGRQQSDQFRKVIEAFRITEFLGAEGRDARTDPIVLLGDFNENRDASSFHTATFRVPPTFTDDSALPSTYLLGDTLLDEVSTLRYRTFPDSAFLSAGFRVLEAEHANGIDNGTFIDPVNDDPLDYIIVSNAIRLLGTARAEVLSSVLDPSFDGLPKFGSPLTPDTERRASDHRLVFADLVLAPLIEVSIVTENPLLFEERADTSVGRVTIGEPLAEDLSGTLSMSQPTSLVLDDAGWTIPAGETESGSFVIKTEDNATIEPDKHATLIASVGDRVAGLTTVEVRSDEPSGKVLISQINEPSAGMTGRALELYHTGNRTLDLASTPLLLYRYDGASEQRLLETRISAGLWKPGAVVVIGDQATRSHLEDTGFLSANALEITSGTMGAAFTNPANELLFVLDNLGFNGDDALEVQLGWERSDVFGRPGEDPGEAWEGDGIRTQDASLELSALAAFGSAGFQNPSGRFRRGEGLVGFGQVPHLDGTYASWTATASLPLTQRGLLDDPDNDGLSNFLEFAFARNPLVPSPHPLRIDGMTLVFERVDSELLRFEMEVSDDLLQWEPSPETDEVRVGTTVTWHFPAKAPRFARVRIHWP